MIKYIFVINLIFTFLITRLITHKFHIIGKGLKQQKTLTGLIRRKTNFEIHHIHFGFLLLIIVLSYYFVFNILFVILLAISMSLIADQIFPLFKLCCYFSKTGIILAILNHIIILIGYLLLF